MRAALFAQVGFQVQFRCFWVTKNAVNQLSRWCPELKPGCSSAAALQQAPICNWITHTCSVYCILVVIIVSTSKTAHESYISTRECVLLSFTSCRASIFSSVVLFFSLDLELPPTERCVLPRYRRQPNVTVNNSRADTWKFLTGIFVTHVPSRCSSWRRCRRMRVKLLRVRVLSGYEQRARS